MSKSSNWESTIKPIVVLSVISLIASLLLALVNGMTAPVIAENTKRTTLAAYVGVLPSVSDASELEEVTDYTTAGITGVVKAPDGSTAIKAEEKGFDGGILTVIMGFDANGAETGIWVDASTQTKGIGSNVSSDDFLAQFDGMDGTQNIVMNQDYDAYSGATPLSALKMGEEVKLLPMIIGRTGGTIGETSVIAIAIGACLLIALGLIDLRIPGMYIATFALFICLFGGHGFDPAYVTAQVAGGGLMLGAFFMATDYVTRPITRKGQYLYGIFLGILTGIFRVYGKSAEGVSYAIIIGNLIVPLLEKVTVPKAFGKGGGHHEK